jgi:hypothetical protein
MKTIPFRRLEDRIGTIQGTDPSPSRPDRPEINPPEQPDRPEVNPPQDPPSIHPDRPEVNPLHDPSPKPVERPAVPPGKPLMDRPSR